MRFSSLQLAILVAGKTFTSVLAGFADQVPPPPQPNDITGTVNGCANAILEHDLNGDGAIRRDEFLSYVNNVADLLCIPPRPNLDLELQTVFVSVACLCQELPGNDISCCFEDNAGLYLSGALDTVGRSAQEESYLRASCLLTQAVLGPEQCELPTTTLAPGAILPAGPIYGFLPPPAVPAEPNNLLWLLLLLLLPLICCICCCCYRRDKEVEEEYEVVVKEETIVRGPDEAIADRSIPPQPMEPDLEQALSVPNDAPPAPMALLPREPQEPFSAGDEDDDGGNAPRPGPPLAAGAPGIAEAEDDEEDEENIGRKLGAKPDDDDEDDGGRRFGGQGMLPLPPGREGVVLRHVEKETTAPGEYEYPERNISEFKYKREDSGQILDHYVPDGGVYDPQRPPRDPVIMPTPKYQRKPKPEPLYIDPRKERKQMGLGDGEVWEALNNWEEEQEKTGTCAESLHHHCRVRF
jgi:hypothetical protein